MKLSDTATLVIGVAMPAGLVLQSCEQKETHTPVPFSEVYQQAITTARTVDGNPRTFSLEEKVAFGQALGVSWADQANRISIYQEADFRTAVSRAIVLGTISRNGSNQEVEAFVYRSDLEQYLASK